jgi:DNA-binding transcriptional regulator YhcF (GntR family)
VILLSLAFGIMAVIPIGGADMPVVISLLNSYSGLAACAAGFAINNNILIVAGSLVGASGIILTQIMCKAMNRSLSNVLFSGFASVSTEETKVEGEVKPISVEDAYYILEAATNVAIIPGYGMAVAQAQHVVKELRDLLEKNGAEVNFGIHPVAGRMPGHMNVLLAEADVPYDQLLEMDDINPRMETVDVAIVIGANDVVNPAATRGGVVADLRHAGDQRRQGAHRVRAQALHGFGLCRHREPAVLQGQHAHALRRCQGVDRRPGARTQRLILLPLRPARAPCCPLRRSGARLAAAASDQRGDRWPQPAEAPQRAESPPPVPRIAERGRPRSADLRGAASREVPEAPMLGGPAR